jgi:hypothetical protein
MPCTSVTDCANRAVVSRNPAVSTALSPSEIPVPTNGSIELAPTAAPPLVTAVT